MRASAERLGTLERRLWLAPLLIVAIAGLTESLPVIFGRGPEARWDWSPMYVTLRLVLLPMVSVAGVLASAVLLPLASRHARPRLMGSALALGAVSLLYLLVLLWDPLPWFRR